ncbi:MAG: MSMEG_4193 family putative phosphomutase [Chloroflexi bacterium]|jgi:probable phosphoglycerate mutase|nr:MAG: phosphoglycerate mutase [Chloroflexi bacterium OLB13]MBC6957880.1 MSMEG_4193 family putative phosphomutase [Chloroflexota bacterium]MBV6437059.1 Phosphoserine phosphatase 1 [Anaerolineae bacterium]MDL1917521.1 MSMEG_4193 family putative phosphomutase [Anaerolineae bacterium CFX4]MBW7880836.1 MSMEG_4193 family putative phosphomutase [Anaerolineae bacterium]
MTTILLIRHAVNDYVKTGKLAGWTPGVHLNEDGVAQAKLLGERLAAVPLQAIYSSPLERAVETAEAVREHHAHLPLNVLEGVGEVQFGEWQGMSLNELRRRKLWDVVQRTPSRATFPGGESFPEAQFRAVRAIEGLVKAHPAQVVAVFSHSDVIKLIVAHYLGMHLDSFQRIEISTASISTVQLGHASPYVVGVNDVSHLRQPKNGSRG